MSCDAMRDLLPLYAGGEVEENERIAVDSHLGLCAECSRELEQYRDARGLLAGLREGTMPPGVESKMWKGVRDELFPRRRVVVGFDWALRYAAVLVIGVATGFIVWTAAGRKDATEKLDALGRNTTRIDVRNEGSGPWADRAATGGGMDLRPYFQDDKDTRWRLPKADRPEGNYYLPRVEAVVAGGEKDF